MVRDVVAAPLVLACLTALLARQASGRAEIACRVLNDPGTRTYTFSQMAAGEIQSWRLSYKSKDVPSAIHLKLPGARPIVTAGSATLSYRTANGGVMIELKTSKDSASLDVYVSYELEVNVDAELSPDVDELNTHGPLTNLRCEIAGIPAPP